MSMAVAKLPLQQGITSFALQRVSSCTLSSLARSPALVSVAAPKLQRQQRWRPVTAMLRKRVVPLASVRGIASGNSVVGSLGLINASPWQSFVGLRAERFNRKKEFVKTERSKRNYRTVPSAEARDGRVFFFFSYLINGISGRIFSSK